MIPKWLRKTMQPNRKWTVLQKTQRKMQSFMDPTNLMRLMSNFMGMRFLIRHRSTGKSTLTLLR
ncbi:unnamed protein product [Echinostoma caproni]|uniref:PB1-F2 protein n=1 Tax=Echinostoma caproni TaxID=27848 RepID=A0A183A2L9_9TREM|nr:unnamed protein product [Echinostoma caproni]